MAELYDIPVEIYEYTMEPKRVFNAGGNQPGVTSIVRLSYHSRNHYNAVVPTGWTVDSALYKQTPGNVEDTRINFVMSNMELADIPEDF